VLTQFQDPIIEESVSQAATTSIDALGNALSSLSMTQQTQPIQTQTFSTTQEPASLPQRDSLTSDRRPDDNAAKEYLSQIEDKICRYGYLTCDPQPYVQWTFRDTIRKELRFEELGL
jgi:hypothetical protein